MSLFQLEASTGRMCFKFLKHFNSGKANISNGRTDLCCQVAMEAKTTFNKFAVMDDLRMYVQEQLDSSFSSLHF